MGTFIRMSAPALNPDVSPFRRLIAAMGVALMLLLSAAAASPALHRHLHDGEPGTPSETAGDTCAVVLFASGIALSVAALASPAPRGAWQDVARHPTAEILLVAPRYLRQPERGPPVG